MLRLSRRRQQTMAQQFVWVHAVALAVSTLGSSCITTKLLYQHTMQLVPFLPPPSLPHTNTDTHPQTHLSADAEWLVLCYVLPRDQLPDEDAIAPDVSLDGRTLMAHNLSVEWLVGGWRGRQTKRARHKFIRHWTPSLSPPFHCSLFPPFSSSLAPLRLHCTSGAAKVASSPAMSILYPLPSLLPSISPLRLPLLPFTITSSSPQVPPRVVS